MATRDGGFDIGVFGWTGVGKTTWLSALYYLLAGGRYPGSNLSSDDRATNAYIRERASHLDSLNWEQIPANQGRPVDLSLDLFRSNRRVPLLIKDYRGEDVSLGNDAEIFAFFEACEGILVFLAPELLPGGRLVFDRQQEINQLLNALVRYSRRGRTPVPVALVVTKYDVVGVGDPDPDPQRLIARGLGETLSMLRVHVQRLNVFAVSTRWAVERAHAGDFPEMSRQRRPVDVAAPLFWLVDEMRVRHTVRVVGPYARWGAVGLGTLAAAYAVVAGIGYSRYGDCETLGAKSQTDPRAVFSCFKAFDESFWSGPPLFLHDDLGDALGTWRERWEEQLFTAIEAVKGDYEAMLRKGAEYKEAFPEGPNRLKVDRLYDAALLKKQEEDAFAEIRRQRNDYSAVYALATNFLSRFPASSHKEEVLAIQEVARPRPVYTESGHSNYRGGGGGCNCFIATAVYGDPDAAEVETLRRFRDQHLLPRWYGRLLVDAYYRTSPPVARHLMARPQLSGWIRKFVLDPIVARVGG